MKNLLVVYPGGCGGNHLANLLSTCDTFNKFSISDSYSDDLLNRYKELSNTESTFIYPDNTIEKNYHGIKTHFYTESDIKNLKDLNFLQKISSGEKFNVLIGHEHDYSYIELYDLLHHVPDPFYIVMTYPEENSVAYRRIQAYKFNPDPNRYTFPFYFTAHTHTTPDNSIYFNTDKFFTKNGVNYLREMIKPLNIELPPICDEMHTLWFEKICEVLELDPEFIN